MRSTLRVCALWGTGGEASGIEITPITRFGLNAPPVRYVLAGDEGEDVEEQWEDQEFSADELEEVYQTATSTCPENPEQAFSETLEHTSRRSERPEEYGWL